MTPKVIAFGILFIALTPGFASADASHAPASCKMAHAAHGHGKPCMEHCKSCMDHGKPCKEHGKPCMEHGAKAEKTDAHAHEGKRTALDVVQHDPCLSKEYRQFAAKNKNAAQRRRFADRLAREGCPHATRQAHADDHAPPSDEPHARHDYRYDVRRDGGTRYDDDRHEAAPSEQNDDEPHYEIHSPLLDLFRR